MHNLILEDLDDTGAENQLFEDFGDKHIHSALRIVQTKLITPQDSEMIYDAMCILVAMYMSKVRNGELYENRTKH